MHSFSSFHEERNEKLPENAEKSSKIFFVIRIPAIYDKVYHCASVFSLITARSPLLNTGVAQNRFSNINDCFQIQNNDTILKSLSEWVTHLGRNPSLSFFLWNFTFETRFERLRE